MNINIMKHQARKYIFVIDDDPSIDEVLTTILELEQYIVKTFTSGKAAIAQAIGEAPDIILLDYFLPGESAENIINSLRGIRQDMSIILMSANMKVSEIAVELSVSEFIPKPFQRETVLAAIKRSAN